MLPVILLSVLFVACVALLFTVKKYHRAYTDLLESNQREGRHLQSLTGATMLWPGSHGQSISYQLKSFDSGRSWVAVEFDSDWRMKVLGDAEQIYPGLLEIVQATNALTDVVAQKGPLDMRSSSDQKLLTDAGFKM